MPGGVLFHGLNQRLPRRLPRHAVVTFHDLFVMTAEYSTPDFRMRFERQARDAASRADHIISVSTFTANQVHELLGVERQRITVIPHGVRVPTAPAGHREPVILCVGALQVRKNQSRLIQAFEQLPGGWRLVLAGSHGYGAAEILEQARRSPRSRDIELPGWVDDATLARLYTRASIFAFPSLDEGFGMPMLEAMANGLPVVTSTVSAMPEVAGDAAVLVDPTDGDALAAALGALMESEALRRQWSERGRERAAQFSWERAVRATRAVYERCL
jgi:glycosyltransferase involved in cell wall biosynthesis